MYESNHKLKIDLEWQVNLKGIAFVDPWSIITLTRKLLLLAKHVKIDKHDNFSSRVEKTREVIIAMGRKTRGSGAPKCPMLQTLMSYSLLVHLLLGLSA